MDFVRKDTIFFVCAKSATKEPLHLLDVFVTQHAKWTAKRIRRGLFGQSLVDFSTESWSSIQLKGSAKCSFSEKKGVQPKKTPRLLRSFAQSRVVDGKKSKSQHLVPGMSQYRDESQHSDDIDMDARNAESCQDFSQVGVLKASAQRTEFFELSP